MPYFITDDNCRIFYETKGFGAQKPVVVFLNGTMQTTLNWWHLARVIKDRFQVLMYDARAQGRSDPGKQKLTLEGHAADLSNLLNSLDVTRCSLVGVSHGAHLALALAAGDPRRVERMILCGIGSDFTPRARIIIKVWRSILAAGGIEALAWAMLPFVFGQAFLKDHEGKLGMIVKTMVHRNHEKALLAHLDALASYPPPSRMAEALETPTVIISGAEDPIAPGEKARTLARLCKGRHLLIRDAGHSVPMEAPRRFQTAFAEFCKSITTL